MLSYLATALPQGTSPSAHLLAVQCALRMNTRMQVHLPKGVLRSLRLNTTSDPWHELEHARWLRPAPGNAANETTAELLDVTLLSQAPAGPDRRRAADWALRAGSSSATGAAEPLPRLAGVYLAAHTDLESGSGLGELDRMARACGAQPAELTSTLDQLAATGLLGTWQVCPDSGDLQWIFARGTGIPAGDPQWEAVRGIVRG
ncbi:hypothetical protein [Streptomyces hokutonensis]|uniref:hypothetical protein n=1 Tax=Streptomyces hokutonensis TaxID=1306990 RepID=UPI0036C9B82F